MSYERENVIKGKDILIAVSLANLFFIRVWSDLLELPESAYFFMKQPISSITYLASIGNVLLLATLFIGLTYIARKPASAAARKLMHFGFLLMLIVPLLGILRMLSLLSTDAFLGIKAALLARIGGVGILGAGFAISFLIIFILLHYCPNVIQINSIGYGHHSQFLDNRCSKVAVRAEFSPRS